MCVYVSVIDVCVYVSVCLSVFVLTTFAMLSDLDVDTRITPDFLFCFVFWSESGSPPVQILT